MSFLHKAFVVTGGASGVGKETVKKLLSRSATVHVIDKAGDFPDFEGNQGKIWRYPRINIASRNDMTATFNLIRERSPTMSGLVHCAGILRHSELSEAADEDFEILWKVNVQGTWNTCTEFIRCAKESPEWKATNCAAANTSMVTIGSMASVRGIPGMSGYVASKHAVLGISRTLAQELGPLGVRVNCIAPGAIRTPMIADTVPDPNIGAAFAGALKQISEPGEIADTALYLLSEESSSITGQVLQVNGGWP